MTASPSTSSASSLFRATALGTAIALALVGTTALSAQAAPGDTSNATGQYLSGSLLGLDAALVASLDGESAQSTGVDQTNANNLNVGALGLVTLSAPGGIQLPIDLGSVGTVSQYASALGTGASVGASGLTAANGDIGTGITPAPGVAPGPLHLNLAQAVSSLGLPTATLNELAQLDLTAGVTAGRAAQAAPAAATGSYSLADVGLSFQSPTVAGLSSAINTQVGSVQTLVNGLAGPSGTLAQALGLLNVGGLLSVNASVDASNLQASVAPLLTGPITDPAYPGITLDLSTGTVSVDLGAITALEGLAPNTDLLTDAVITEIGNRVTGLVGALLTRVTDVLTTTIDGLGVDISASLPILGPVITVDATIGSLLSNSPAGITVAGIPINAGAVLSALLPPLQAIGPAVTAIGPAVIAPIASTLIPALKPVLNGVLTLTVNNQATAGGVFTETALRATVLPAASALILNIASATVGPNALAAPPTITAVAPASGPETGGTPVTITGTGFTGATGVTFGGDAGTAFTIVDDTTITVTTPPHAPGAVDVVVQSPFGDSVPGAFTFLPVPAVTGIAPIHGPETGGTAVTVTGTGFTGATGVTFGGDPGIAFTVVNDTTITVTTPAHAPGAVDVVVQHPNGDSAPGDFTFDALPVVTGVAPDHGPETGGTPVTITGSGFTGSTGVTFAGTPATDVTVVNDTTITATSPAHAPGAVDVVVQNPNGDSAPGDFTFDQVPVLISLTPDTGPETGGTPVTITGTGFTGATGVTFGGTAGTAFTVVNDTTITVDSPAHAPGLVDVVVQHPSGDAAPGDFTFTALPTVTGLSPNHGPETGGTVVTITGSGLTGTTGVTFDGTPGTGVTVVDDSTITVTTPAGGPGAVSVVVQSPAGDTDAGDFTFDAVPAIASLDPTSGPQTGGTVVTITGTGFTGSTGVTFDGVAGTAVTVVDDTTITVTTPPHLPGPVDVVVQNPNGASAPADYTYVAVAGATTITGLTPDHGPVAGGTVVTITGTAFTGATQVTFDGTPGTALTVVNDTTITVTTPAHAAGPVDAVVTGATSTSPAETYTYDPSTTVDTVTPGSGPESGGTTVTIAGQCFTGATGVLFGATPATSFTVVDDATITAVTPAGVGIVDVTVVGAGTCGTGTIGDGFVYIQPPAAGGGGGAATAGSGGGLAGTGSDTGGASLIAGLAVLLMLAGAVAVARRRHTEKS
ncbi:IPT/TIG domain-containing protein [Leifsonia sp. NPDC058292]|uniref:IPT/TIG domain-containing protein n=1 Tax=Leifsonia sp. NPDC058292 TaxID=3346428 RepID=UPI0036DEDEBD